MYLYNLFRSHYISIILRIFNFMIKNIDGWTDADVKYMWKLPDPVQMADNLLLPGGFELANYTDDRCDIKTSTGMYLYIYFSI